MNNKLKQPHGDLLKAKTNGCVTSKNILFVLSRFVIVNFIDIIRILVDNAWMDKWMHIFTKYSLTLNLLAPTTVGARINP